MIDHSKYLVGREWVFPLFIGGEFREPKSGKYFEVSDPSNNKVIARVAIAGKEDVDDAVMYAKRAFEEWNNLSISKRKGIMKDIAEAVKKYERELAIMESLCVGSPYQISKRFSVPALSKNFEYYSEWIERIYGEVIPVPQKNAFDFVVMEPLGIVAGILSWNTPSLFIGSKCAPALAAGNSVIIKPSEKAPLPALKFAEIIKDVVKIKGLIQVLPGLQETGEIITTHPEISGISFTGGTEIGKKIMAQASSNLKRVSLELGGKSPAIIFSDADLDRAVMMCAFGVFALAGQMCVACSRIFIEKKVFDEFVQKFVDFTKGIPIGDPLDEITVIGPLNSKQHLERVLEFIEEGKREGKLIYGGERIMDGDLKDGNFLKPTIFTDIQPSCRIAREEIFGPVTILYPFETEEEVLEMANDTKYGLSAGIFTRNLTRAIKFSQRIKAGQIWINTYSVLPHTTPFGGIKESGFGKEGGKEALLSYLNIKNVYIEY